MPGKYLRIASMQIYASQLSSLVIGLPPPSPYLEPAITLGNDRVLLKRSVLQSIFATCQ